MSLEKVFMKVTRCLKQELKSEWELRKDEDSQKLIIQKKLSENCENDFQVEQKYVISTEIGTSIDDNDITFSDCSFHDCSFHGCGLPQLNFALGKKPKSRSSERHQKQSIRNQTAFPNDIKLKDLNSVVSLKQLYLTSLIKVESPDNDYCDVFVDNIENKEIDAKETRNIERCGRRKNVENDSCDLVVGIIKDEENDTKEIGNVELLGRQKKVESAGRPKQVENVNNDSCDGVVDNIENEKCCIKETRNVEKRGRRKKVGNTGRRKKMESIGNNSSAVADNIKDEENVIKETENVESRGRGKKVEHIGRRKKVENVDNDSCDAVVDNIENQENDTKETENVERRERRCKRNVNYKDDIDLSFIDTEFGYHEPETRYDSDETNDDFGTDLFGSSDEEEKERQENKAKKREKKRQKIHFFQNLGKLSKPEPKKEDLTRTKNFEIDIETGKWKCPDDDCDQLFFKSSQLETHYKAVHLGRKFKCEFCSVIFSTKGSVLKHMDLDHPDHPPTDSVYVCEICGQKFRNNLNMSVHKRITHLQKLRKKNIYLSWCKLCHKDVDQVLNENGLILSADQRLLFHYKMLHKEHLLNCPETDCVVTFVRRMHLQQHFKKHHLNNRFKCEYCSNLYLSNKSLRYHLDMVHSKDIGKPMSFKCTYTNCAMSFSCQQNLKLHECKHRRVKKVQERKKCLICNNMVYNLELHEQSVHERAHLSICNSCGKTYTNRRSLQKHIHKVHEGIRTMHPCHLCSVQCSSKEILKGHISGVHQKTRFPCPNCDCSYSNISDMRCHVKAFHGGQMAKCRFCDRTFGRGPDRNRHERQIHGTPWTKYSDPS